MNKFLASLAQIAVLLFAVTSMASVGLAHGFKEVVYPLRNLRAVFRVLVANFVLVPILGFAVARMLALTQPVEAGLILVAMAAGAPFLVKLTAHAEHDVALSATLLVLLLPMTVVYIPLVVPLALPDTRVSLGAIGMPLFLTMLLPLAVGMMIHERLSDWAERLQPIMRKVSTVTLIVLIAATLFANLQRALNMFGTGAILAAILLICGAFLIGYALGGHDPEKRGVLALATAQRNISAATVVATQGFEDSGILVMVIISSLVGFALLFPAASVLRQRAAKRRFAHSGTYG
jgi:predicted Na+-dependent transporter